MNKTLLWIAIAVILVAIAAFLFLGKSPSSVNAPTSPTEAEAPISGDPDVIVSDLLIEDPQSPAEADPSLVASDESSLGEFDLDPNQF
ncbi:MAG: hypothetical protein Q7R94_03165 [bacterium]|nr:hypothetical protein [bacterium]